MFTHYDRMAAYLQDASAAGRLTYQADHPLARLSTFRIGGPAAFAVWPGSADELASLIALTDTLSIPAEVIGNGSNILFDDRGYDGVIVVTTSLAGIRREGDRLIADCGVPLTHLAATAEKEGLGGLAFAYGIPGTVGGAVFMNAGAYGGEMKDVAESVSWYDRESDEFGRSVGGENGFSYRVSRYQTEPKLILSASFALTPADPAAIRAEMDDYMARRKDKQPLEYPSAGSVFKRCPPYFAGKLIEDAGLKGLTVGGAQVSEKHAGFIVNRGGATSADVLELIDTIRHTVRETFGVTIEPEIRYLPSPEA